MLKANTPPRPPTNRRLGCIGSRLTDPLAGWVNAPMSNSTMTPISTISNAAISRALMSTRSTPEHGDQQPHDRCPAPPRTSQIAGQRGAEQPVQRDLHRVVADHRDQTARDTPRRPRPSASNA